MSQQNKLVLPYFHTPSHGYVRASIDFLGIGLFIFLASLDYNSMVLVYSLAMILLLILYPMLRDVKAILTEIKIV